MGTRSLSTLKTSAFIEGNESAYIAESPGVHPEFRFDFVPALSEQRAIMLDKFGKGAPDAGTMTGIVTQTVGAAASAAVQKALIAACTLAAL